jgi:hypothetical protein
MEVVKLAGLPKSLVNMARTLTLGSTRTTPAVPSVRPGWRDYGKAITKPLPDPLNAVRPAAGQRIGAGAQQIPAVDYARRLAAQRNLSRGATNAFTGGSAAVGTAGAYQYFKNRQTPQASLPPKTPTLSQPPLLTKASADWAAALAWR